MIGVAVLAAVALAGLGCVGAARADTWRDRVVCGGVAVAAGGWFVAVVNMATVVRWAGL